MISCGRRASTGVNKAAADRGGVVYGGGHAHNPGTGSVSASAADVGGEGAMASSDPDRDTWDKLSSWDRRTDALAPLTEKQMDSVLELRAAAESVRVPSEVRGVRRWYLLAASNTTTPFTEARCVL